MAKKKKEEEVIVAPEPEQMSQRKFAKLMGCSEGLVRQAIETGKITKDAVVRDESTGKVKSIIVAKAQEDWSKNQRVTTIKNKELHNIIGTTRVAQLDELNTLSIAELEVREKAIKVAKDDIDLKVKEGSYVPVAAVNKAYFFHAQVVRGRIQGLPRALVDDLIAANGDRVLMIKIMEDQIITALEDLSKLPDLETA